MAIKIENFVTGTIIKIGDIFEHLKVIDIIREPHLRELSYVLECDAEHNHITIAKSYLKRRTNLYCNLDDCKYALSNIATINDQQYSLLPGSLVGNFEIISRTRSDNSSCPLFEIKCICGASESFLISKSNLELKTYLDCGQSSCTIDIIDRLRNLTLYVIWSHIKDRCYNVNNINYPGWGGRGIIMFAAWINDFQAFKDYIDTLIPNKLQFILAHPNDICTLGRIDNDGNYEPNNLRWETYQIQNQNRRDNVVDINIARDIKVDYKFNKLTINQIANKNNINYSVVWSIVNNKTWSNA